MRKFTWIEKQIPPMNVFPSVTPSKTAVLIACLCVLVGWALFVLMLFFMLGLFNALAAGMPSRTPISNAGLATILGIGGLLSLCSLTYFVLALSLRCPHCTYQFLKNPKGFGSTGFSYHPSCPRIRGFNPWSYQITRFLRSRRMRCIKCGEELFHAPQLPEV